jgi:hypothetical protein
MGFVMQSLRLYFQAITQNKPLLFIQPVIHVVGGPKPALDMNEPE